MSRKPRRVIVVKQPVQEKIDELILKEGRKYFGSSGASLTHEVKGKDRQTDFAKKSLEIGLRGERRTTLMLKDWVSRKKNVVLVDSVHLKQPGVEKIDGKDTDHVLIMGNTIVLVDTKVWKRNKEYKIGKRGTILRNSRNFNGGRVNSKQAIYLWKRFFPEAKNVFACVCIQQEDVFVPYDNEWRKSPFKLVTASNLFAHLDYIYDRHVGKKEKVNTTIAAKVIVSAIKPLDLLSTILVKTKI